MPSSGDDTFVKFTVCWFWFPTERGKRAGGGYLSKEGGNHVELSISLKTSENKNCYKPVEHFLIDLKIIHRENLTMKPNDETISIGSLPSQTPQPKYCFWNHHCCFSLGLLTNFPFPQFTAVIQIYDTAITKEFVVRGNDALVKCSIPSFVTDFVTVVSWTVQSLENSVEVTQGATLSGKLSLCLKWHHHRCLKSYSNFSI